MEKKLNSNHLKLLAIAAMTVDHIADLLFPGTPAQLLPVAMHIIGRLTAPIMWFFICEGYFYTRNLKKYMLRMFAFSVISHFAYCFAFGINMIPFSEGNFFNQTSVIWTLAWSLAALWAYCGKGVPEKVQPVILFLICLVTFPADWSCIAVLAVISMYKHRGDLKKQILSMMIWVIIYAVVSFFFVSRVYGIVCLFAFLVYFPLKYYNGQKGRAGGMKWLFYIYYPAHLVVIGILRLAIYGDVPILF